MGIVRYLLALAVVVIHSDKLFGLSMTGGRVAVQAFFIISGFYMFLILNEKYIGQKNSYKVFIVNRFLRIFPIYIVILILSVLVSAIMHYYFNSHTVLSDYIKYQHQLSFFNIFVILISNLLIFGQEFLHFFGINPNGGFSFAMNFWDTDPAIYKFLFIPQAWSISIELLFYILVPFFVRRNLFTLTSLIFVLFIFRYCAYMNGFGNDPFNYRFFPFELIFFLLGGVAYHIYKTMRVKPKWIPLLLATFLLPMIVFYGNIPDNLFILPVEYFVFPIKDFFLFALVFLSIPFLFTFTKYNKTDRFIGELSYPLYISHILIKWILIEFGISGTLLCLWTIILSTFFSIILVHFFVTKIDNYRHSLLKTTKKF